MLKDAKILFLFYSSFLSHLIRLTFSPTTSLSPSLFLSLSHFLYSTHRRCRWPTTLLILPHWRPHHIVDFVAAIYPSHSSSHSLSRIRHRCYGPSCHIDNLTTLSILLPPSIQAILPLTLSRLRHRCYSPSCHIDNFSTSPISPSCWSCCRHLSMLSRSLLSCSSCGGVFLGVGCDFLGGCCRLCLVVVFFCGWLWVVFFWVVVVGFVYGGRWW